MRLELLEVALEVANVRVNLGTSIRSTIASGRNHSRRKQQLGAREYLPMRFVRGGQVGLALPWGVG